MKSWIFLGILLIIFVCLAMMFYLWQGMKSEKEAFLVDKTGISSICPVGSTDPDCYDISYVDSMTETNNRVSAKILPGYYIDVSGYLATVPYGYTASADKRSYDASSNVAKYVSLFVPEDIQRDIRIIDASMTLINTELSRDPPPDQIRRMFLEKEKKRLEKERADLIESQPSSSSNYNPFNYGSNYRSDEIEESQESKQGKMFVKTESGNLASIPWLGGKQETTLYYSPGTYQFNAASYVPNYEESVFLSKLTNNPTTTEVKDLPVNQQGFCESTKGSTIERDAKCNALDNNVCASTSCCVLLGGEKCVAGNRGGPTMISNYSDTTIINRDYYYYQGKCYGNCLG
jgi:hypothetical protein